MTVEQFQNYSKASKIEMAQVLEKQAIDRICIELTKIIIFL